MNILLFDVDGVLIEDHGYRAGVVAALNYFARLMGTHSPVIDASIQNVFHARGFTNEWDICPFAVGVMIVEALARSAPTHLQAAPLDLFLQQFGLEFIVPLPFAQYLDRAAHAGGKPSERALAVLLDALSEIDLNDAVRQVAESTLREMLSDPYDVAHARTTQVFQEHVLGSAAFEEVYQLKPRFDVPSLLYTEDRPTLTLDSKRTLNRLSAARQAHVCVYTARPSLPPADEADWLFDSTRRPIGYSPEAELALQMIELDQYPLIAMGRMQWLAAQVKQSVESLTKPAPVQALAAIGAALTRQEAASLTTAYRLVTHGELTAPFSDLRDQAVHIWVVEDATLGLQAVRSAIDLLRHYEIDAHLHGIGISPGGPKAEALAPWCEVVLTDVNEAIAHIADALAAS